MQLLWEPAIYEHKAALIGKTPADVAYSADLLARAMLAEYDAYRADLMTVGIDIYNVEAEACGALVNPISPELCPEIATPPWRIDSLPELSLPDIDTAGRFAMIAQAAMLAREQIGHRSRLRVGVSGPVSLASKLVGCEDLIIAAASGEQSASDLLNFALELAIAWCRYLRHRGLDVIVFDSNASPPNFSPELYRQAVLPLHSRLMSELASAGQSDRPLIMGGNTAAIASAESESGATTLLCDYAACAAEFAAGLPPGHNLAIRRNVSPQTLQRPAQFRRASVDFARDLDVFHRPIAGTGILPYRFEPELFGQFREQVNAAASELSRTIG